jgi:hypothetical protein
MRKVHFAVLGAFSLALAACGGQQDDSPDAAGENVDAEELNALADNAAMEAENEAIGNEAAADEPVGDDTDEVDENATDPSQVENDVQGM